MKKRIFISFIMVFLIFNLTGCFGPGINDYHYFMVKNYEIDHSSTRYVKILKNDNHNIGCKSILNETVTKVSWDDNFILAEQTVQKKATDTSDNQKINYWIIDVNSEEVYGPFNEEEFNTKRNELSVNPSLQLNDPEKFKALEDLRNDY
ncbi:MAG: DUF3997 domain-containing protein [Clostridiaceae bacterium]